MKATFRMKQARPKPITTQPASRVAQMLALAYCVERLVEDGTISGYSEAARLLGVSRSRMAQIVGLLGLSAEMQSRILVGEVEVSERMVRVAARELMWEEQRQS